jgi:hypothetical protein
MAFTMAYPNFKKGLKMVSMPLGIKWLSCQWEAIVKAIFIEL